MSLSAVLNEIHEKIDEVVHHTENAVSDAVAEVKKGAQAEAAKAAADVKSGLAALDAALKSGTPLAQADLQKLAADAVKAVEAALASHGL